MPTAGDIRREEGNYPPENAVGATGRSYRDNAAVELYKAAGVGKLVKSSAALHRALSKQADKLDEFPNSPYSKQSTTTIKLTLEAIERSQQTLQEWHYLCYPNQRPQR